jgi:hypothetical protein
MDHRPAAGAHAAAAETLRHDADQLTAFRDLGNTPRGWKT